MNTLKTFTLIFDNLVLSFSFSRGPGGVFLGVIFQLLDWLIFRSEVRVAVGLFACYRDRYCGACVGPNEKGHLSGKKLYTSCVCCGRWDGKRKKNWWHLVLLKCKFRSVMSLFFELWHLQFVFSASKARWKAHQRKWNSTKRARLNFRWPNWIIWSNFAYT